MQLLHHADFEGNTNAIEDAPRLAALFDYFDDTYVGNTLKLSGGDNWIPSPWYNSQESTEAMNAAVQSTYESYFGLESGALSGLEVSPGTLDQAILNVMGIQASTLGNHEFDAGPDDVARIIEFAADAGEDGVYETADISNIGSLFPYLSTNLDFSENEDLIDSFTSELHKLTHYGVSAADLVSSDTIAARLSGNGADLVAPYAIASLGNETIGLVGATTQRLASISSPDTVTVEGASNDDMDVLAAQVQASVDGLAAQGINKVILISHLQDYTNEASLATKLSGVDIILSAGSDAIFADSTDVLKDGDTANETSYPLIHTGTDGNPILQVNTDGQYNYLGRLVVDFDEQGVVDTTSINASESGAYAATDAVITSLYGEADPYQAGSSAGLVQDLSNAINTVIGAKLENVAGYSNVFLDGQRSTVRNEESNLGNLTADANLYAAQQYILANSDDIANESAPLVSLKNGGGIRAEIGLAFGVSGSEAPVDGEVNQLDIETTLAFNNGLVLYGTTAAGLKNLLEHGIDNAGTTSGRFPHVGGLKFSYESNNASGEKIVSLALTDGDGQVILQIVEEGAFVVSEAMAINLVSLNFLVENDGDGYPFAANQVGELTYLYDTEAATTFESEGREQKAFFDYMQTFHNTPESAYNTAETSSSSDTRIMLAPTVFNATDESETFVGDAGIDIVVFGGNFADYSVNVTDGGYSINGTTAADTLTAIERLKFDDTNFALDLDGHAGITAKILGAVYGADSVENTEYVGIGLSFLDGGTSYEELVQFAIDSRLGANASHEAVVELLYTNVVGTTPGSTELAFYLGQLGDGTHSVASLGVFAAESIANITGLLDVVGVNPTGIEYIEFG